MKDFWEKQHDEKSIQALSGHPGQTVLDGLYLYKLPKANPRVLEIGVGLGICTLDLIKMGANVDCLDIAIGAIERVKHAITHGFLNPEYLPDDTYDLAISYCVTQHMDNTNFTNQLKNVIRSLKPGGVFAMQYAIPYHTDLIHQSKEAQEAGSVCRTVGGMNDMIEEAGGKIVFHRIWGFFPQYNSGWAIVHMVKGSTDE